MDRRLSWYFGLLVLIAPFGTRPAAAQATTLTGTVYSGEAFETLPGAHVFLAGTMIGTVTNEEGMFRLERVPLGAHRLYVSMIGYEPAREDLVLRPDTTYTFDIELKPEVYEVGALTVEAERNRKWERQFKKFVQLFLGETENAFETTILNAGVLDFAVEDGRFTARASEPLIIENRALGYRIHYYLRTFYEESSGSTQRIRYLGEPESYTYLRATTHGAHKPSGAQVTLLTSNTEDIYIDLNGTLLDPFALDLSGYLGFERVAEALPFEYAAPFPHP